MLQVLTSADSPACIRLVFNDAATYNSVTKTGGMDGSIVLRCVLACAGTHPSMSTRAQCSQEAPQAQLLLR